MLKVSNVFTLCILILITSTTVLGTDKTFEEKLRDGKVLVEAGRFKEAVSILKKIEV